jgi:predicted AlkP superfamily pyrophosphatase or phosphodiesterase
MPLAQQVILFVIDGLRPDALQQAPTPYIDQLVTQGSYTWQPPMSPNTSLPLPSCTWVPPTRWGSSRLDVGALSARG